MERWLPVSGYEGIYEVSDLGRVRSLDRIARNGRRRRGMVLKQQIDRYGYRRFHAGGTSPRRVLGIHRLVLLAFVGPAPDGAMETLHRDGDPSNNKLVNLRWGTSAENSADTVRHGKHRNTAKTQCPKGHAYDESNTYVPPGTNNRVCRACHRARYKEMAA